MQSFDFRKIVDEANLAIFIFDEGTQECCYANQLGANLIKLKDVRDLKLNLSQLFPSSQRGKVLTLSQDLLSENGNFNEVLLSKLDGSTAIVNLGVRKVATNDHNSLVLMLQDVTFQHKLKREINMKQAMLRGAYDELLQQNAQLLELDQAKNRFVALVTHELRTPLSAIVAVMDVLTTDLCDDKEQEREFIKMVHEQSLLLQALVNDILDFAKIQAGKMEYYVEQKDLAQLVAKQVEHYRKMASTDKIEINFIHDTAKDHAAYFDNLRMTEVINNILSNAIKYNRESGKIFVDLKVGEEFLTLSVRDTGLGIPPDKVVHVFNEFETVGSLNNHHKGTGLGMPICKRLIEAMGGNIYLESEVDVGTTFYVEIPTVKILPIENYRSREEAGEDLAA